MVGETKVKPYYTYADYEHWEDQWELIEGNRVEHPSPVPRHALLATRLTNEFFNQLKGSPTCTVYQPLDYRITDDTVLIPDMLIVCGEIGEKYLDFPPVLVAEILSPSTASRDKKIKFNLYESQGVLYYLILSPESQKVEIYQWENGKYALKLKGRDIHFTFALAGSKAKIDFSQIW
jgi:Uma2 family endonuclease